MPILERVSGLKFNRDFFAGYSPERINPGDKEHRLTTIRKVTSGSTPQVADFVDRLYGSIVTAGTHKTSSIRVAEAAKVIENTQRDVNIALINELALIFNRLRHRHRGGAEGRRQQVELPAVPARTGRRALHRRRSVLPHAQGAGDRLPRRDDPRRAAPERQHGAVRDRADHPPHGEQAHPRQGLARAGAGHDLQGELPRHPQLQGGRRGARARAVTAPRSTSTIPWANAAECRHEYGLHAAARAAARRTTTSRSSPWRTASSASWAPPACGGCARRTTSSTTSSTSSQPPRSTDGYEDSRDRRGRLHRLAHRAASCWRAVTRSSVSTISTSTTTSRSSRRASRASRRSRISAS